MHPGPDDAMHKQPFNKARRRFGHLRSILYGSRSIFGNVICTVMGYEPDPELQNMCFPKELVVAG